MLALGFGERRAAYVVLALIVGAALLESVFALCIGCKIFAALMRAGIVSASVCEECADLSGWLRAAPTP